MEDVPFTRGECDHKFRQTNEGVLVCESCGLSRQPRMLGEPGGGSTRPSPMESTLESIRGTLKRFLRR